MFRGMFYYYFFVGLMLTFIVDVQACAHTFFDELREPGTKLPNGRDLPLLFNFTEQVTHLLRCHLQAREYGTRRLEILTFSRAFSFECHGDGVFGPAC